MGTSMQKARLIVHCTDCGSEHTLWVNRYDYARWQGGELIQNAMPYLSADERELLISGICGTCWDELLED